MGKTIAIAIQKGGSGKTTSTINLGAALARKQKKTLLLDLDGQANLTLGLGLHEPPQPVTMYEAMIGRAAELPIIPYSELLHVVPASLDLQAVDNELANVIARELILKKLIAPYKDQYDFILLDCPPSLMLMTINAMAAADEIYIPVASQFFAMSGLDKIMFTQNLVKEALNPLLKIGGIFITQFDARKNIQKNVRDSVGKLVPAALVMETIIRYNVSLEEAPAHGTPVFDVDPTSNGAADYDALAVEFLRRHEN